MNNPDVLTGVNPLHASREDLSTRSPYACQYEFHKARYRDDAAPIALRNDSARWLLSAGFIGLDGKEILIREEVLA